MLSRVQTWFPTPFPGMKLERSMISDEVRAPAAADVPERVLDGFPLSAASFVVTLYGDLVASGGRALDGKHRRDALHRRNRGAASAHRIKPFGRCGAPGGNEIREAQLLSAHAAGGRRIFERRASHLRSSSGSTERLASGRVAWDGKGGSHGSAQAVAFWFRDAATRRPAQSRSAAATAPGLPVFSRDQ